MKILIVDDEKSQRDALAGFLKSLEHEVHTADSAQSALAFLHKQAVNLVLSDFKMPYMTGNDLLQEIRSRYPALVVMIMTAYGTVEAAVAAMKAGAWDFIAKPLDLDQLEQQLGEIEKFLGKTADSPPSVVSSDGFIARDTQMLDMLEQARRVAASEASVLITGETGTGKEELARFIHKNSQRAENTLHTVNCAALPANLVESELFGHVKGAFTGAAGDRKGHFAAAHESTLFLDEIGDLPAEIQVKLLRFLQNSEFTPVGSNELQKTDVRIITATNVDLQLAVEQGDFREDLLYRLDVIRFHLPPLRERPADIEALTAAILPELGKIHHRPSLQLDEGAQQKLLEYAFPGNVRELRNILERAVVLTTGDLIGSDDLQLRDRRQPVARDLKSSISNLEQDLISRTLTEADGNQSECARRLGISERVLRYKLQKYDISD